jgi:hypothetical protein
MKVEFITCGNHTEPFLSQAAIFRRALDSLGGDYAAARLVLCVGGPEWEPLPARWRAPFRNIELRWVCGSDYTADDVAQSVMTYRVVDPSADLSVICDADTLLVSPFPEDFLTRMQREPALAGCIAHYPPPLHDTRVPPPPAIPDVATMWARVAARLGVPVPDCIHRYAMTNEDLRAPFYINLGFLAGPPQVVAAFHRELTRIVPLVREVLENEFYEQIALPFAAAAAGLCVRALPIRFNFPNDPVADRLYPDDMASAHVIHYLRRTHFDRHVIFNDPAAFAQFMAQELEGSNAVFQSAVRRITGGVFPFPA